MAQSKSSIYTENYTYKVDIDYVEHLEMLKSRYKLFVPQKYMFSDSKKKVIKIDKNLPYKGTISNGNAIIYYGYQHAISFHGWLVPERYNKIEVIADGKYLGNCIINMDRRDVYRNYPQYVSKNSGFSAELFCPDIPKEIRLNVYQENKIVYSITSTNIIKFDECKKEIINSDGMIMYYRLIDFAKKNKIDIGFILDELRERKKIICCFGNCQILSINPLIATSNNICQKYLLINIPPVHTLGKEEQMNGIRQDVLRKVDLFIYQYIKADNKFSEKLSIDYIISFLKNTCKKICIPNCYFTGYFPQYIPNKYNPRPITDEPGSDPLPYGDKNIQNLWESLSVEEIQTKLHDENFYSIEEVQENAEKSLEELRNREKNCNVVISDYIDQHYKTEYLFYTPNHVSNHLLKELMIRVFRLIGIDCSDIKEDQAWENSGRQMPIYPSVKKSLGLTFNKDTFIWNRVLKKEPSNLDEYVEAYVQYCKPEWEKQRRNRK